MILIIHGSVQLVMVPSTIAAILRVHGSVQIDNVYIACTDSTAHTHHYSPAYVDGYVHQRADYHSMFE